MTGLEMHEYFVTELTQWRKKARIDSKDIYYWLNSAQDDLIEDRFGSGDYGRNRRITEDLQKLFVKDANIATTYVGEIIDGFHCDECDLPSNHLYTVAVRAETKLTSAPAQTVDSIRTGTVAQKKLVRLVQSSDVYRLLDDPFHRPQKRNAIGDSSLGEFHVYANDTFVVTSLIFDYIKKPTAISNSGNSDLPTSLHQEIVTNAVTMFLNKEQEVSQKHQSNSLESLT